MLSTEFASQENRTLQSSKIFTFETEIYKISSKMVILHISKQQMTYYIYNIINLKLLTIIF